MAAALADKGASTSLTWADEGIDIQAIESALNRLREEAGTVSSSGEQYFATRTSVLNLVAYAQDKEAVQRASEVIASLSEEHPSRSIILATADAAGSGIEAHLSAHCHRAAPQQQVCCEEIALTVRGTAAGHLHSIVIPLLVTDLPVVFWWMGDWPADAHIVDDLVQITDRLLVDSAAFTAAEALPQLAHLCHRHESCGIGDFNWTRINPWRELVAQLFDAPALAAYLPAIAEVEVEYATDKANPTQAILLTAWLAERLGWKKAVKLDDGHWRLRTPHGVVTVQLHSRPAPQVQEGTLLSLGLKTKDATFDIRRSDDPQLITIAVNSPGAKLERTLRIKAWSEAEMLSAQLNVVGHDRIFEETLALAVSLTEG